MKKECKLGPQCRIIMAAVFAITNIGMPMPEKDAVMRILRSYGKNPPGPKWENEVHDVVVSLGSQHMETNEHERMFAREARMWYRDLGKKSIDDIKRIWPEHYALFEITEHVS